MKKLTTLCLTLMGSGTLFAASPMNVSTQAAPVAQQQPTVAELSQNTLPSAKNSTQATQTATVTITLKANATTGYQWYAGKYDHQVLKLVKYHYDTGNSKLMGAPGKAEFTFAIQPNFRTAPQVTQINFYYQRPWEHSGVAQHKVIMIQSNTNGKVTYHEQSTLPEGLPNSPQALVAPAPHTTSAIPAVDNHTLEQKGLYQGLPAQPAQQQPTTVTRPSQPSATQQPMTQSVHQAPIEQGTTYHPQHSTSSNGSEDWLSLPKANTNKPQ